MGRDDAKALITKWRIKARSLEAIANFLNKPNAPETAKLRQKQIQAYEECAEDLDVACGRLS